MANFYAHDHTQSARSNPNVVPLSSRYTKVAGAGGVNHVREGVELVKGPSHFRPYEPPAPPKPPKPSRKESAEP
jgi:hypothetical protein